MHGVEERTLDAALAAAIIAARVLERYKTRVAAKKEEEVKEVEDALTELQGAGAPPSEGFAVWLARKLGVKIDQARLESLRKRIHAVDPLSLAGQGAGASDTPLLSPLWILRLMQRDEAGWRRYQELWSLSCSRELEKEWSDLLTQVLGEKAWLPVQPLPQELTGFLDTLVLRGHGDAAGEIRYGEVVRALLQMLDNAARLYSRLGSVDGFFETMSAILTFSLLLVPAWAGSRPPDAPLSTVSALLGSLSALRDGFAVIALDINGIQDFIYAPVKEAAASRVLRGRSLLVELVQFTVSRLAAEILGALAQLTKEGGAPTLITPPPNEQALRKFSELLSGWMAQQFMARLWVTVAASQRHDTAGALCPGEPLHASLEELRLALTVEKSRRYASAVDWLRGLSRRRLDGFDSLTHEPILEDDLWALNVSQAMDYADELAPGKLKAGDRLSGLTHISLACGNVTRNLAAIVSIYFFKGGEPCEQDARVIAERLAESLGEAGQRRLYIRGKGMRSGTEEFFLDVALVPFSDVGAVHLLASLSEYELGQPQRNRAVSGALLRFVLEKMRGEKLESDHVHFEVRIVNATRNFLLPEELAEELKGLAPRVGVTMLPFYTNTYHPVIKEGGLRLVDLDEMPVIAVALLDADGTGEVFGKLSRLPVALVSSSDFLSLGFGAKAYACLMRRAAEEPRSIILYAGGDDISVYGRWYDVVKLLSEVGEEVLEKLLKPLTASGGISLADNKTPILHLAAVAQDAEREAKRERRARGTWEGLVRIQALTTEALKLRGDSLDLSRLACCLNITERLRESKAFIYALAELADEAARLAELQKRAGSVGGQDEIMARARVVVGYKYLLARREKDFRLLKGVFEDCRVQLPLMESNSSEIVGKLVLLKPLLDLLALRLREYA
jgi:CRISPR-associated protein Csm1